MQIYLLLPSRFLSWLFLLPCWLLLAIGRRACRSLWGYSLVVPIPADRSGKGQTGATSTAGHGLWPFLKFLDCWAGTQADWAGGLSGGHRTGPQIPGSQRLPQEKLWSVLSERPRTGGVPRGGGCWREPLTPSLLAAHRWAGWGRLHSM